MSHFTRENESCHTDEGLMSNLTWQILLMSHDRVMTLDNMNESCHTHQRVMSHTSMSHPHVRWRVWRRDIKYGHELWHRILHLTWGGSESCHTDMTDSWQKKVDTGRIWGRMTESWRWIIWTSHVTHINESCRKCKRVMSHTSMSHVANAKQVMSHIHEWVMLHMQNKSCHTYMNESCRTCKTSHVTQTHVSRHTDEGPGDIWQSH